MRQKLYMPTWNSFTFVGLEHRAVATLPGVILVNRRLVLCLIFLFVVPYLPARVTHVEITSPFCLAALQ